MAYLIEVQNDKQFPVKQARIQQAASIVLDQQSAPAVTELTVVITDDEAITRLNQQYRDVNLPTDVLSFSANDPGLFDDASPYLGDIVIAYPYATAQAEREGHDLDDSLDLLVVHGVLHLLGYDHDTPENRSTMWNAQAKALDVLGISQSIVPSLESEDHE